MSAQGLHAVTGARSRLPAEQSTRPPRTRGGVLSGLVPWAHGAGANPVLENSGLPCLTKLPFVPPLLPRSERPCSRACRGGGPSRLTELPFVPLLLPRSEMPCSRACRGQRSSACRGPALREGGGEVSWPFAPYRNETATPIRERVARGGGQDSWPCAPTNESAAPVWMGSPGRASRPIKE